MRSNASRRKDQLADPSAYWRRRFIILAGGFAVLALLAWLLPGVHSAAPAGSAAAARASMAALQARGALPSAAYGSAWPVVTQKPSPAAAPTPAGATAGPAGTPGASAWAAGLRRCVPGDIVLSLFTSQPSYAQGAQPRFDVYAVSTASSVCQLPYGPGSVRVIVTRNGQVVWDSAACRPPAARPARFQLGVPEMLAISWNRKAASPAGCAGSLPRGGWGTFQAVAMAAGRTSPVRTFKLLR